MLRLQDVIQTTGIEIIHFCFKELKNIQELASLKCIPTCCSLEKGILNNI